MAKYKKLIYDSKKRRSGYCIIEDGKVIEKVINGKHQRL